jgi:hypothetical protein
LCFSFEILEITNITIIEIITLRIPELNPPLLTVPVLIVVAVLVLEGELCTIVDCLSSVALGNIVVGNGGRSIVLVVADELWVRELVADEDATRLDTLTVGGIRTESIK